ncbi:unnamed protein product [Meloidogyne enterolobii]|uniref:Uncharacterized protein n=1 Tax=Meloidogyne enterolobii TaxID=390850 RepID=A0ACB1AVV3_MELEN
MIFCHLIIIERICATVFIKCYETKKGRIFTSSWIFIFVGFFNFSGYFMLNIEVTFY